MNKSLNFITTYHEYTPQEIEKMKYGLEGIYLTLSKLIIIFFISFLLGVLKETILVLVFFNILRFTGFGFHAGTSNDCLLVSTILFSGVPFLFTTLHPNTTIQIILIIACLVSFLLFAPADTIKRPLPNKKKRIIRKIVTLFMGFIYTSIILIFPNLYISTILFCSLICEAIMLQPLLYKLFKQPYRNYKTYSAV